MSHRQLVPLLWTVIGVLVVGFAIGTFLLVHHANEVDQDNQNLNGSNQSLHRQVDQLRAVLKTSPSPSPTASPLATPEPSPSPSPKR